MRPSRRFSISGRQEQPTLQSGPTPRMVDVLGSGMAYLESGSGSPVLFIHGGIASCRLWERQMSALSVDNRCIAVDLVGTGYSRRLLPSGPTSYSPALHLSYLESFISLIRITEPITLVVHGWGSMIGFAYAQRHPSRIRAICHMESIIRPLRSEDLPPKAHDMFARAKAELGRHFVMDTDEYFELATRRELLTPPGKAVLDEFRATHGNPGEMRRALHTGLTMVPIEGEPRSSVDFVAAYAEWLRKTPVPKLLICGEPGFWVTGDLAEEAASLPTTTVTRVAGGHLLPLDSPDGVATLLAAWIRDL